MLLLVIVPAPPVFHSVNRREFLTRGMTVAADCALALRPRAEGAAPAGTATRTFQESVEILPNPERGFYAQRRSDRMNRLESLREQGISLLLVTFDLRDFREGAFAHIARRLGYRFVAERLTYPRSLRAGGSFAFELTLKNSGFASPHLPRVVEAGLLPATLPTAQPAHSIVLPDADPRWWSPEAGAITLRGALPVPAGFPRGSYRLALRLADPAERLRNDRRYAISLANQDIFFSAAGGWNVLAEDVSVERIK